MKKPGLLLLIGWLMITHNLQAEYRAYLVEVYDHIAKKKWDETTGFSPDLYITTHGGGNRLSVFVKATWQCYGDTSNFQPSCPMPEPIQPVFQKGEQVKITLEKHITQGWIGTIELAYFQADVKSNVYGVRFGEKRQLYNRYFEFNLEKAGQVPIPVTIQGAESTVTQPVPGTETQTQP
jgi:hypothetical protein